MDPNTMFYIVLGFIIVDFVIFVIIAFTVSHKIRKRANKAAKERGYDDFMDMAVDRGAQMNDKTLDIMDQVAQGKATINVNHTGNNNSDNTIIKVRCPHCGYLESEDAVYCSKCGRSMK
jgi:flagellar biosynthesis/type III secretory pathway M-ring protein FliF/YscJ